MEVHISKFILHTEFIGNFCYSLSFILFFIINIILSINENDGITSSVMNPVVVRSY